MLYARKCVLPCGKFLRVGHCMRRTCTWKGNTKFFLFQFREKTMEQAKCCLTVQKYSFYGKRFYKRRNIVRRNISHGTVQRTFAHAAFCHIPKSKCMRFDKKMFIRHSIDRRRENFAQNRPEGVARIGIIKRILQGI